MLIRVGKLQFICLIGGAPSPGGDASPQLGKQIAVYREVQLDELWLDFENKNSIFLFRALALHYLCIR